MKREILARGSASIGLTRLLESFARTPLLIVLTYHRIGVARETPFDSGVFSCRAEDLHQQIVALKKHSSIVTLDKAKDLVHGRASHVENSVLLTFDDGYRDNYEQAFPVLRELGVTGTFYLPTEYVGTGKLPWWDQIAYIVKSSTLSRILVTYPEERSFRIDGHHRLPAIRAILRLYKGANTTDSNFFIDQLAKSCGTERIEEISDARFLTWDEARTMKQAGMSFGSHTHTHRLLGKLTYEEQVEEMSVSRSILERELGGTIDTIAYPVGSASAFSAMTFEAARATGYKVGFSFYGGVNRLGRISPLNVLRVHSGQDGSAKVFRLRMAMLAAIGRDI